MKRRLFWLAALAGLVWLYLRRSGRKPQPFDSRPADELRRKLDETSEKLRDKAGDAADTVREKASDATGSLRESADDAGEKLDEATDRIGDEASDLGKGASSVTEDLDAKRREVHERAREAAAEMRDSTTD
jgi:hypothetical protein